MPRTNNDYFTTDELAERLAIKPNTLERWRSQGVGPPFVKVGNRAVRYKFAEVEAWLEKERPAPGTA